MPGSPREESRQEGLSECWGRWVDPDGARTLGSGTDGVRAIVDVVEAVRESQLHTQQGFTDLV